MTEPTEEGGRNFVDWLSGCLSPGPGSSTPNRPSDVPRVLRSGAVRVAFQPVVDLRDRSIFAYEALARSSSPHFQGPPALFHDAIESRCCGALGRILRELSVEGCPDYPLFLNVHPNEFDEGWLVQPDDPIFTHPTVYLEITESVPLSHFVLCHSVLKELRHKGVKLAVDDLGSGYSNLKYIADLSPEIVKLDRELVSSLQSNVRLRKLVTWLVRLCEDLGARVVAEGVEDADEARAVMDAGAHFAQGFYFARPAFAPPMVAEELFP